MSMRVPGLAKIARVMECGPGAIFMVTDSDDLPVFQLGYGCPITRAVYENETYVYREEEGRIYVYEGVVEPPPQEDLRNPLEKERDSLEAMLSLVVREAGPAAAIAQLRAKIDDIKDRLRAYSRVPQQRMWATGIATWEEPSSMPDPAQDVVGGQYQSSDSDQKYWTDAVEDRTFDIDATFALLNGVTQEALASMPPPRFKMPDGIIPDEVFQTTPGKVFSSGPLREPFMYGDVPNVPPRWNREHKINLLSEPTPEQVEFLKREYENDKKEKESKSRTEQARFQAKKDFMDSVLAKAGLPGTYPMPFGVGQSQVPQAVFPGSSSAGSIQPRLDPEIETIREQRELNRREFDRIFAEKMAEIKAKAVDEAVQEKIRRKEDLIKRIVARDKALVRVFVCAACSGLTNAYYGKADEKYCLDCFQSADNRSATRQQVLIVAYPDGSEKQMFLSGSGIRVKAGELHPVLQGKRKIRSGN